MVTRRRFRRGWRALVLFLAAALLAPLGVAGAPVAAQTAQPGPPDRESLKARLVEATSGRATIAERPGRNLVTFFGTDLDRPVRRPADVPAGATPEAAARRFLRTYGPLFGIDDEARQLRLDRVKAADGEHRSSVRFQQVHEGVPVVGGELIVNLDRGRNVLSANGEVTPRPSVDIDPGIAAGEAAAQAVAATAKAEVADPAGLAAAEPELWVYDPELLGPSAGPVRLVWRTEVTGASGAVNELVLVDARTAAIALQFSQIAHAKLRRICDRNNVVKADETCSAPYTRTEGGPATGIADVDRAYDYAGQLYDFLSANFGRDSLDGAGLPLVATVRYCEAATDCPEDNAFWNGAQSTFGQGYTTDDIVAHEFTHGLTDFESDLFYYYQSGAINESLSDVFGEIIDLLNGQGNDAPAVRWQLGEEAPGGAVRNMANPPATGDPDAMDSPNYFAGYQDSGGVHTNSGVNNKAAVLMADGGTFNGLTVTGLGLTRTAHLYYEANANLLTSGSDYQDLYQALRQACRNKVGVEGITVTHCTQVQNALDAVRMNVTAPATAAEAPVCAAGQAPSYLFFDTMENAGSGNWTFGGTGAGGWGYATGYATSGVRALFSPDPTTVTDRFAARSANVVPADGATTYLHFRHSFDLERNYDGGLVEYSTNGGSSWSDAGPLFVNNGYNHTNSGGPLASRQVFAGESHGFISSRLDISSLAGQNVRVRFRVATDSSVGWLGWHVDDVRIYTCGPAPVIGGSTWHSGGEGTVASATGTVVNAFATGAAPGTNFQLVTATEGCAVNPVAVNPQTRTSNASGFVPITSGDVSLPAGTYELCFRSTDGTKATAPVFVTVV